MSSAWKSCHQLTIIIPSCIIIPEVILDDCAELERERERGREREREREREKKGGEREVIEREREVEEKCTSQLTTEVK